MTVKCLPSLGPISLSRRPRREGAAVRCRAPLDVGVEAAFEGTAPGYKLEEAAGAEAAEKTATGAEATLDEHRGGWVERLLEEVRREFSGLPVYVGVEEGYVKRTASMDQGQFRRYLETCRRLGFRFDRGSSRWRSYSHLQRYKPATAGRTPFMDRLVEAVAEYLCRHRDVGLFRLTLDLTRRRLFAEIGAVSPSAPGTETWWAAVREAVYVLREKWLVGEAEVVNWTGLLKKGLGGLQLLLPRLVK